MGKPDKGKGEGTEEIGGEGTEEGEEIGEVSCATALLNSPEEVAEGTRARADPLAICRRLQRDGRWREVEPIKDDMIREARKRGMLKLDAQAWAYSEIDRLYPPLPIPEPEPEPQKAEPASTSASPESGQVQGLGRIPEGWPALPPNASLQAELAWVQANRLTIVAQASSGAVVVHLAKALSPAPSMAALGWLETSIRSYAKFVDVLARAMGAAADEVEHVRRERLAIEEIRALLREMRA